MRNILLGAAALALLGGALPVAAASVCEKMKPQYPMGYCDSDGAFHTGSGETFLPDGRKVKDAKQGREAPQQGVAQGHSGTSGHAGRDQ